MLSEIRLENFLYSFHSIIIIFHNQLMAACLTQILLIQSQIPFANYV